jgi:hypothetical protein
MYTASYTGLEEQRYRDSEELAEGFVQTVRSFDVSALPLESG